MLSSGMHRHTLPHGRFGLILICSTRELYSNYNIIEVDVRRCINAKVTGRRGKELIICNY